MRENYPPSQVVVPPSKPVVSAGGQTSLDYHHVQTSHPMRPSLYIQSGVQRNALHTGAVSDLTLALA